MRATVAVVVAVVVALVVTAFGWAVARDDGTSVGSGRGGPSEHARYLRLEDGRAGTIAVWASDRVQVWWRGPDEPGWSAPEVVDGGRVAT